MLWSPNEVIAYIKEDLGTSSAGQRQPQKLNPSAPFGGFQTWPNCKEDFILIAENSEIHGPNPLLTIPKLDSAYDLNTLSTQILSADYQGLSNNKVLPSNSTQLIIPELSSDLHAAVSYFYLFDSEARGFVRPTCFAYFTTDKHKLVMLERSILKYLDEAAKILQHSNLQHQIDDLRQLKDSIKKTAKPAEASPSRGIAIEARLKEVQDILDIAESYQGNDLYDKQIDNVLDYLNKNAASDKVQNLNTTVFSPVIKASTQENFVYKPNVRKCMKNLYIICKGGVVLGLYHLFVMHKHFRRKYENIVISESFSVSSSDTLNFGACVHASNRHSSSEIDHQKECIMSSFITPSTLSMENLDYSECLDSSFEEVLLNFIDWDNNELKTLDRSSSFSSHDLTNSSEGQSSSSRSSGYLSFDAETKNGTKYKHKNHSCRHTVPLDRLWELLEHIKIENPGIEESFLQVLKLFDNTQKLLFALFTRTPVVVISTPRELYTAQNFIKALSVFIPRKKDEALFVDYNRQDPLKLENFSHVCAVNFCRQDCNISDLLPLELMPSLCVLNLKECSFTAPAYNGCLLGNIDSQIRMLPSTGSVFPVLVSQLLEIESTMKWWHMLTASSVDTSSATQYVLSKGFNRLDMQIIEKLSRLCKG